MSTPLTIQSLIQHFENRLRQIDRHSLGVTTGKEPQYPMLVVFLGNDAIKGYSSIASHLFQIWPQYQDELQFIGVTQSGDTLEYIHLSEKHEHSIQEPISNHEVSDITTALFGLRNHFQDRSKLFVYYILDTTSFVEPDEYDNWLSVISRTKGLLGVDALDVLDMLVLLLNENFSRKTIANQIRNRLCNYYATKRDDSCSSVFLLSNKRSDNAILEDWETCYRIISSMIALSNNDDAKTSGTLFNKCIMTASYAREEKPSGKIGQVIVRELVDELAKRNASAEVRLLEDDLLPSRLGLTRDGTLTILDQYVAQVLLPMLPSPDQLNLFPRRDDTDYGDMSQLSAREFNEITMCAWDCCLAQIAKQAREKVNMDSNLRQNWSAEYIKLLCANFSTEELIYLADHIDDVRNIFIQKREPAQEVNVLSAASAKLRYMLSSDARLIDVFIKAIESQGRQAGDFLKAWNQLLQSRLSVFSVKDENITMFYERKARNYFDHHGHEMVEEFRKMQDIDRLQKFLENILDKIIDSDAVFASPFEEELESRLREEALPIDAKQYIRQKLTGDDVYTYLQVNFNFGQPLLSSILLKVGTPLYSNLFNNLAPTTYYYNTGCGNAAEATVIYEVSPQNLINGESR